MTAPFSRQTLVRRRSLIRVAQSFFGGLDQLRLVSSRRSLPKLWVRSSSPSKPGRHECSGFVQTGEVLRHAAGGRLRLWCCDHATYSVRPAQPAPCGSLPVRVRSAGERRAVDEINRPRVSGAVTANRHHRATEPCGSSSSGCTGQTRSTNCAHNADRTAAVPGTSYCYVPRFARDR